MGCGRELGDEHSALCAHISADPAHAKRSILFSAKVRENAQGFAAYKVSRIRNSDALPTLNGEIIHCDPESLDILVTKQRHGKGPVQSRPTSRLTQVQPSAHV